MFSTTMFSTLKSSAIGLAFLMVWVSTSPAWAELPAPALALQQARQQLERGEFERAIRTVEGVLRSHNDLSQPLRAEAYRLTGLAQLYLGREAQAKASYERLLEIQPDYQLPESAPPKVRSIYERIQEEIRMRRLPTVTLTLEAIPDGVGDKPVTVHAQVQNLAPGLKAKLHYRKPPASAYDNVDFNADERSPGQLAAQLPAYDLPATDVPYSVEYYAEIADAAKRRFAGKGTPELPLQFTVLPHPESRSAVQRPWYQNPWVWGIAGAVVVAGTIATVAVVRAQSAP